MKLKADITARTVVLALILMAALYQPAWAVKSEWNIRIGLKQHLIILRPNVDQAVVDGRSRSLAAMPLLEKDTLFIPVRAIEEVGIGSVSWDGTERRVITEFVSLTGIQTRISFKPGSDQAAWLDGNGSEYPTAMPGAAFLKDDRLFLPVRILSGLFDRSVHFQNGMIFVSWNSTVAELRNIPEKSAVSPFNLLIACQLGAAGPDLIRWHDDVGKSASIVTEEEGIFLMQGKHHRLHRLTLSLEEGRNLFEISSGSFPLDVFFDISFTPDE